MGFPRAAVLLLPVWAAACTSEIEPLTPAQREAVAAYVSETQPSPQRSLTADYRGRVKLLGYDLGRAQWQRGETMRVTWHWQVLAPPGEGWKLFTHIVDPASDRVLNQDGNGTLRRLFGPQHWRAGQYIRDVQDLHLPKDWAADTASLYVGFEGQPRTLAATLPVSGAASERSGDSLPRLVVVRTSRSPRLDGSLRDPVWGFAHATRPFVETRRGGRAPLRATARLLWDDRYLFVGVDVDDSLLLASDTERDAHLWEQDCVELMIDPDGDGKSYFEIQVSPRGVVFDTRYDSRRAPKPFGHIDWDSRSRVGVSPRGNLDDREGDAGYTVEIAIPWQAFSPDGQRFSPPAIGDEWRANFYVMDRTRDRQQAAAWSPVGTGDFHVPRRFGILTFEGRQRDMLGTNQPTTIPAGRAPKSVRRGSGSTPSVNDTLIQRRQERRKLESSGGGH